MRPVKPHSTKPKAPGLKRRLLQPPPTVGSLHIHPVRCRDVLGAEAVGQDMGVRRWLQKEGKGKNGAPMGT